MQFLPTDIFGQASGLSSGKFGSAADASNIFGTGANDGNSSFRDVFASLSAFNENNTPGVSLTTRSTRDDTSFFKSDEYAHLKGKLTELGVAEDTVNEYFAYLSVTKGSPGIAVMRSAVSELQDSRLTAGPDKQEFTQISATLSKLGFSNEEISAFEQMMHRGDSLGMLKKLKEKVEALAESGTEVEIDKDELDLLIKACDISHANYSESVLAAWESFGLDDGEKITLNENTFNKLFGTTIAALETRESELCNLAANIDAAIESMLEYRSTKNREAVADMRGNALTERSETMARILATMINEENEEREENSTSHLMDDRKSGKSNNRESIAASLADDRMTSKAVREERRAEAQTGLRSENSAQAAENAPREPLASHGENSRHDMSQGQKGQNAETGADKAAFSAKVREEAGVVFSMFGQTENSSTSAQSAQTAKTEMYHERIFDQIERGIIKNASDGSKQIVMRLDPPELGKLTLSLTVAQGEVKALIRTESTATTQVVSEQLAQLKQSLEEQGFKVSSLEVETRSQSHAGSENWNGAEQHNQEREMLEQARFLRLARTRAKEGSVLAQSMQHIEQPASISASGLHIIA